MAQLTLTVDDTHVDRIRAAYAEPDQDPATVAVEDVRQDLIRYLVRKVRVYEDKQARLAAEAANTDVAVS